MGGGTMPGADVPPAPAPISRWTIPLAVLSMQEGGVLPVFMVTVLPPGEFSVPETQVLLQPAAQSKQAVSGKEVVNALRSRR